MPVRNHLTEGLFDLEQDMSINFLADLEMIDNHDYEDAINKEIKESLETGRWGICYRYSLSELFAGLNSLSWLDGYDECAEMDLTPAMREERRRRTIRKTAIQRLIVIAAKREEI